jgi:peptide/nickel transport system permease protein
MGTFLLRRTISSVLVLIGVLFVVHALILLAGDPTSGLLPVDATPEMRERLRDDLGLDEPVPIQFVQFLGRAVQGDFGESHAQGGSALDVVLQRLPATLALGVTSLLISLAIGIPLGALSGLRPNSVFDYVARFLAALSQAIPTFWLGLMLMLLFGVRFGWLPISGSGDARHLILPGLTIALSVLPAIVRIFRSSLLGVIDRDYIRTARSKGLSSSRIFRKHVLRNASLPLLTVIGFQISSILSSALVAEVIFAYPGMGRLASQAVATRDLAVIQVFVLLASIVVLVCNMLIDLSYALLDPRVRVR